MPPTILPRSLPATSASPGTAAGHHTLRGRPDVYRRRMVVRRLGGLSVLSWLPSYLYLASDPSAHPGVPAGVHRCHPGVLAAAAAAALTTPYTTAAATATAATAAASYDASAARATTAASVASTSTFASFAPAAFATSAEPAAVS